MRGLWRAAFLLALPLLGCAPRPIGPPPQAPAFAHGVDAIPGDVDLVVRLDLSRVRSALGPELVAELRRAAELAAGRAGTDALVAGLLEQTDVLYVGLRPRLTNELDHVIVLEGSFSSFEPKAQPSEPGWLPAEDLGADVRRWDRRSQPKRGTAARIYDWSNRVIVLATPVEIDSTERAVEIGERGAALKPPSKGLLSFAARVLPLAQALEERSPEIGRLLRTADRLEGSAEIDTDGVRVELALRVDSEQTAQHLRELFAALADLFSLKGSAAEVARSAQFDVAGTYVTCRITLPRSTIAGWLRCADGNDGCSW